MLGPKKRSLNEGKNVTIGTLPSGLGGLLMKVKMDMTKWSLNRGGLLMEVKMSQLGHDQVVFE